MNTSTTKNSLTPTTQETTIGTEENEKSWHIFSDHKNLDILRRRRLRRGRAIAATAVSSAVARIS